MSISGFRLTEDTPNLVNLLVNRLFTVWEKASTYSIKVWASAVIISPILWAFAETVLSQRWKFVLDFGGFYFAALVGGAIVSLPALGVFILTNRWLFSLLHSEVKIRLYSSALALLINVGTFALFLGQDDPITWRNSLTIPVFYTLGLLFGIWFFKVGNRA